MASYNTNIKLLADIARDLLKKYKESNEYVLCDFGENTNQFNSEIDRISGRISYLESELITDFDQISQLDGDGTQLFFNDGKLVGATILGINAKIPKDIMIEDLIHLS